MPSPVSAIVSSDGNNTNTANTANTAHNDPHENGAPSALENGYVTSTASTHPPTSVAAATVTAATVTAATVTAAVAVTATAATGMAARSGKDVAHRRKGGKKRAEVADESVGAQADTDLRVRSIHMSSVCLSFSLFASLTLCLFVCLFSLLSLPFPSRVWLSVDVH